MMVTQLTLEPHDARLSDPPTSHAAGRRAGKERTKNQERVLAALRANPEGLTDFETAALTGLQQTSAGKRRLELQRAGLVEPVLLATPDGPIEKRRQTPSGSTAIVWRSVA